MIDLGTHNLLGIRIAAVDYAAAVEAICTAAHQRRPFAVSALAVHGVMTGALDRTHAYRLNQLEMLVPDGQPVRWGLNLLHGLRLQERVYGPTLMLRTCQRAAEEQLPIFLFGGSQELLQRLQQRLCEWYPALQVAGTRASRFRQLAPGEKQELVDEIVGSGARITFVGLGCPRQEVWAYEFRELLSMPVLAVGAAFNFHAGLLPQAPPLMQAWGLEWLFRLSREPGRLWKRYLVLNPLYLSMLFAQWARLRRFSPTDAIAPAHELLYG